MRGPAGLPALVESFFLDRLMRERQVSPHTITSYRDTFRLLLQYAHQHLRKTPTELTIPDLDAPFFGAFLDHLRRIAVTALAAVTYALPQFTLSSAM